MGELKSLLSNMDSPQLPKHKLEFHTFFLKSELKDYKFTTEKNPKQTKKNTLKRSLSTEGFF